MHRLHHPREGGCAAGVRAVRAVAGSVLGGEASAAAAGRRRAGAAHGVLREDGGGAADAVVRGGSAAWITRRAQLGRATVPLATCAKPQRPRSAQGISLFQSPWTTRRPCDRW